MIPTERDDIVPDDEAALVVDDPTGDNPYDGEPGEQEDGA